MDIKLRKASMGDGELLLRWRNDPIVYRYYLTPEPVDHETHMRWLCASLQSDVRQIYIVEENDIPVGMVRLDNTSDDGHHELSWAVDPAHQGRGIGTALLKQTRKQFAGVLLAEILSENVASIKMAEAAGFTLEKEQEGICYFRSILK